MEMLKIAYNNSRVRIFEEEIPMGWTWLTTDHKDIVIDFWLDYKVSEKIINKQVGEAEVIYEKWRNENYVFDPFTHTPQRRVPV